MSLNLILMRGAARQNISEGTPIDGEDVLTLLDMLALAEQRLTVALRFAAHGSVAFYFDYCTHDPCLEQPYCLIEAARYDGVPTLDELLRGER